MSARTAAPEGFLILDKPRGPTSHQVAAWVRNLLGVARAGHGGTLDPNASGLLWIGVGRSLKLVPLLLEMPKRYVGVVAFHAPVTRAQVDAAAAEFTGPIYQTPPLRSAVRRARRRRTVHRFAVVEADATRAVIDVTADSGTYVRTLAVDVGEALGVEAHLEELRRIGIGPFSESDSVTLQQLADRLEAGRAGPDPWTGVLRPDSDVWKEFPSIRVRPGAAAAIAHGADLARGGILRVERPFAAGAAVVLLDLAGSLLATGVALAPSDALPRSGWVVDARRVFVESGEFPPSWRGTRGATGAPDGRPPDGPVTPTS